MSILFLLSGLVSEIIGTMAGFGSSTIFLPLALFFFDLPTALALVAFFHLFGNISRAGFFRFGIDKSLLIRFGIPSVIFTIIGAILIGSISLTTLKAILGAFFILYAIVFIYKRNISFKPTTTNAVIGGGISGFIAGLIGTGGALRGMFLTAFNLPKEKYIATAAVLAIAVDITRIPLYLSQGFFKKEYFWYLPILFLVAVAGSFIGKRIVKYIPQDKFRIFVLVAILLVGIKFVFQFFL